MTGDETAHPSEAAESRRLLRRRPDGLDDAAAEATGRAQEALERVERARGHLYSYHQLMGGHADLLLGDACDTLRAAGPTDVADRLESEMVGRNVMCDRWTFQVVEDFDDNYWSMPRDHERAVRAALTDGVRHIFEAEMKEDRRSNGRPGHEAGQVGDGKEPM